MVSPTDGKISEVILLDHPEPQIDHLNLYEKLHKMIHRVKTVETYNVAMTCKADPHV